MSFQSFRNDIFIYTQVNLVFLIFLFCHNTNADKTIKEINDNISANLQ